MQTIRTTATNGEAPAAGLQRALWAALQAPERLVDPEVAASPARVAAGLALGALGAALWAGAPAVGPGAGGLGLRLGWLALPPLLFALSFPPLVLAANLAGRPPGLRGLAALALAAPAAAGTACLALCPLLGLYALTSTVPESVAVVHGLIGALGLIFGVVGATRTAEAVGAPAPPPWVVRLHAVFTLWTAAVLAAALR
jgi:hypothetical protein